jgi:hypothetical protein
MEGIRCSRLVVSVLVGMASVSAAGQPASAQDGPSAVCRPVLGAPPVIELGKAGIFTWTCGGSKKEGGGYYIVFIRPLGTYVLLKVPRGETSFEFAPDVTGMWRWIVINTDPDRARPDVESEPGFFHVISSKEGAH